MKEIYSFSLHLFVVCPHGESGMIELKKGVCISVLVLLLTLSIVITSHTNTSAEPDSPAHDAVFQEGMSYRHYPYPYDSAESNESLTRMAIIGVEYVALTVWWKQENADSTEIYSEPGWTATDEELKCAVDKIHELGMKAMLKPMVDPEDCKNHWRGEFPGYPEWFDSYRENITNHYAEFAEENDVELFCIGCEFWSTEKNVTQWQEIISDVRVRYSGSITYAVTLDHYELVTWWDSLDYVGIDAYFPLTNKYDPTLEELKVAWSRTAEDLESWQTTVNKPVVFTEIGYRSGNGTNIVPWEWQTNMIIDLQEQVDCYEAAFQVLWNKPWFCGFYWWIWESDPEAGGPSNNDFTPQNKPVQYLITTWYSCQKPTLNAQYEELLTKFNNIKPLLYIFIPATMILAATTIYFATRKPKIKP